MLKLTNSNVDICTVLNIWLQLLYLYVYKHDRTTLIHFLSYIFFLCTVLPVQLCTFIFDLLSIDLESNKMECYINLNVVVMLCYASIFFFHYNNLEKKCKDVKVVIRNRTGQNTTHKVKE